MSHNTLTEELLYGVDDGIGRITFNRPEARNALTFRMYERLSEIVRQAENDSSIKVLIDRRRGQGIRGRHGHF